ncbi:MAG: hypothetical protein M1379_00010 [Firmicutes bacterium]|nr:hypothetical protein [Bacillota bacterium]
MATEQSVALFLWVKLRPQIFALVEFMIFFEQDLTFRGKATGSGGLDLLVLDGFCR